MSSCNNFFSLIGATIAIISCSSSIIFVEGQPTCPPAWIPSPDAFGESDYITSRQICTDACNADGYCCTKGNGGCAKVPCTTGCHLAFFSSTLQECYDQCDAANAENDCYYTHERHPDIANLGFNPIWGATGGQEAVATCGGALACGCPVDSFSVGGKNECSADACKAGCLLAQQQDPAFYPDTPQDEKMYRGLNVQSDPRLGKDPVALMDALTALDNHVTRVTTLSWTEINDARVAVEVNGAMIPTTIDLINAALLLIENYDALVGPLFLDVNQFPRTSTTEDGNELRRAIRQVQQAALEGIYAGTPPDLINRQDRLYDPIVESCTDVLANRSWGSHNKFPGKLLGTQGPEANHIVSIDTNYGLPWGKKVCYSTDRDFRITGLYLVAGQIATVTVPQSVVDHGMFRIQVGANDVDTSIKDQVKRVDRITSTYEVKSVTTTIANPFGGTIYILVPNPCELGTIDITIGGGVVKTPKFEFTSTHITTEAEWDESRTNPAPWFDLITDNYHMAVPSVWVNGYGHTHMLGLAEDHSNAMSGVNDYLGYPQDKRNKVVLYNSVDQDIRQGAYAPGNPQVNNEVSADANGPQSSPVSGQSNSWLVTTAVDAISMHEMSHCQLMTMYAGEGEAIVNVAYGYVKNMKFGEDLDSALIGSFVAGNFSLDDAMTSWLITQNFRDGKPMDISNTEYDQVRYQRRGYGKYFAIAKLLGWNVLSGLNLQENNEQEAGTKDYDTPPHSPTETDDDRTYRMSLQAGQDLRPFIHVWGVQPKDLPATAAQMDAAGLIPSTAVLAEMQRYADLIPKTQSDFIAHFERVWPGMKDAPLCSENPYVTCCASELFGCGWYNKHYPLWNEDLVTATESALNDIIVTYWGVQPPTPSTAPEPTAEPTSSPTPAPTPFPTPVPTPFPTSLPLCENLKPVSWCEGRCPHANCMNYCSCEVPNPTPSDTCSCEDGGPEPATPSPTPPATPAPTSAATPPATPPATPEPTAPATPQATPKPTAPPPPAACLAKNRPCSPTTPCCGSCNTNSGKCSGNRLLRGRNDDGDQEDRSLGLFGNSRTRQPVTPSESGREKKMVGKLQLLFDAKGNVNNVNRKDLHKALHDAQRKWAKNNKSDSYSFVFFTVGGESVASEQTHPVTVTVVGGQLASMTNAQTGESVPADDRANIPSSIDHMLDRINKEIDGSIASFEAQYYDNGVPKKVCKTKILPKGRTDMDCTHISNLKWI